MGRSEWGSCVPYDFKTVDHCDKMAAGTGRARGGGDPLGGRSHRYRDPTVMFKICMSSLLSVYTYPSMNRIISESISLSIQPYIPIYPSVSLFIHTHLSIYPHKSTYLSLSVCLSIYRHPSIYLPIYPYESIYPFVHVYLPILSKYLAAYLCTYLLSIYLGDRFLHYEIDNA